MSTIQWVLNELAFPGDMKRGSKGSGVKRLQEWLWYHGLHIGIDASYGPATESAVKAIQNAKKMQETGEVNQELWNLLLKPLVMVLEPVKETVTLADSVLFHSLLHLAQHPIEIPNNNCGPWVRLYCRGQDGAPYAWCAGFVSFIYMQAAIQKKTKPAFNYTLSCDNLASQAKQLGDFISEADIINKKLDVKKSIHPGSVFLIRNPRNPKDWIHTGIVVQVEKEVIHTIEGNTNAAGAREGIEVRRRIRQYKNIDFAVFV